MIMVHLATSKQCECDSVKIAEHIYVIPSQFNNIEKSSMGTI